MSSLLGLAGYDSDGSDGDDANTHQDAEEGSPEREHGGGNRSSGGVVVGGGSGSGNVEENSDSQPGEPLGYDGISDREVRNRVLRASSFDAPAPPSKESRQFFMPLPSPLVRLDNASPIANSPFVGDDPPDTTAGGAGVEDSPGGGVDEGSEEEGDGDIIKPEYRDMLPPEATGQANPALCAKIAKFLDRMQGDFTKVIKGKKDYGNPAVLAQICHYCTVDDKGTNYPADRMVHPSVYDTKDFHDSLMAEERKASRPDDKKRSKAAAAAVAAVAGRAASEAAGRAAAEATASAAATAAAPASATTTKRGSKWGLASNLPFIGQPMKMASAPAATAAAAAAATAAGAAASAAAAVAAAAAAAAKTAAAKTGPTTGRVGFSADPTASSARTGQAAMLLNAQVQAQAQADKEAQQRAEAIARVQMIASRVGKAAQEQPPKKPRLS